jgi:transcriptional regulator with XRE-family HTH domain
MDNPIHAYRTEHGLTLEKFSEETGIHYQALYLTECGVYHRPFPRLIAYLMAQGLDEKKILRDYETFQIQRRQEAGIVLDLPAFTLNDLFPPVEGEHPLISFRSQFGLSRMSFCKSFCLHPAWELTVEQGQTKSLGEQLHTALIQARLDPTVVGELEERVIEYHGSF